MTVLMQDMTKKDRQALITLFKRELNHLDAITTTCSQCTHGGRRGFCAKFKENTPPGYDGSDCDEWRYDEIPFDGGAPAAKTTPATKAMSDAWSDDPIPF